MAMSTFRKIYGGPWNDTFDPPHRPVDYTDNPPVVAVASRSRQAWLLRSDVAGGDAAFEDPMDGFRGLMSVVNNASDEEIETMKNSDRTMTHTPIRDAVYQLWNHVFWDVSEFLAGVGRTGTFKIPAQEVLELRYPEEKVEGEMLRVAEMQMDRNILISAVFIEPGVKIRVFLGENEYETLKDGVLDFETMPDIIFDATESTDMYNENKAHWIRRDQKIQIFIGGKLDKPSSDLAAVLVYGKYQAEEEFNHSFTVEDDEKEEE